jgi:4-amino-4-deoxy-L-arabinose transferase-like glycosyltransferase
MTSDERAAMTDDPSSNRGGAFFIALLLLLLVAAGTLRLFGFDWGSGQHLHPDEIGIVNAALGRVTWPAGTSIDQLFDPATSPLNPRSGGAAFPYGALPLYLSKAVSLLFTAGDYKGIWLTGRVLAGLFDTSTVLLVFLMGTSLWGRWWGLLAAALYGFGVLPVQISHFFIPEPFMGFFMVSALLFSLLYYQGGRAWMIMLAGLSCGLAMSCKLSAAPALVLPFAALLLREVSSNREKRSDAKKLVGFGLMTLAGALFGLFVGDPYGVLDASTYLAQVSYQAAVQSGAVDLWFTRRYVDTLPVVYPWWQMVLLGVGPLVGLAGNLGVGVAVARLWRREWIYGVLLAGALVYFASIAFLEAKWVRYLLPLVPYLCLFATLAVMWVSGVRGREPGTRVSFRDGRRWAGVVVLVASAILAVLALMSVYTHEHTKVQASRWLYANVAQGGKIGVEINDGVLPLRVDGHQEPQKEYNITQLRTLADFPSEEASTYLRDGLRNINYLVVGSIRGVRTVPKMPWRYPVQEQFYDLLFEGKLGFSLAYTATSYPSLFGVALPDDNDWVDASFIEYDHPTVRIFKKDRDLSAVEWNTLFADAVKKPSIATRSAP